MVNITCPPIPVLQAQIYRDDFLTERRDREKMVDQVTQLKIKLDTETSSLRLQVGEGGRKRRRGREEEKEGRRRGREEEKEGRRRGREEEKEWRRRRGRKMSWVIPLQKSAHFEVLSS